MDISRDQKHEISGLSRDARDFSVKDRVVMITGAGQGIGGELARQFAAAGSRLSPTYEAHSEGVAAEMKAEVIATAAAAVDISTRRQSRHGGEGAEGFGRIDVLINNASLFSSLPKSAFDQIPVAEWQRVMDVNMTGVFLCARAIAPVIISIDFGRIINDLIRLGTSGHEELPPLCHLEIRVDRYDQFACAGTGAHGVRRIGSALRP